MYHLKLIKGLSYSGIVSATQKNPDVYVPDETIANKALATGYFKLVSGEISQVQLVSEKKETTTGNLDKAQLESMKAEDLKCLASEIGISIAGKKKADLIEAISAVEVSYDSQENVSEENEVDYGEDTGSPTMIDLQKE